MKTKTSSSDRTRASLPHTAHPSDSFARALLLDDSIPMPAVCYSQCTITASRTVGRDRKRWKQQHVECRYSVMGRDATFVSISGRYAELDDFQPAQARTGQVQTVDYLPGPGSELSARARVLDLAGSCPSHPLCATTSSDPLIIPSMIDGSTYSMSNRPAKRENRTPDPGRCPIELSTGKAPAALLRREHKQRDDHFQPGPIHCQMSLAPKKSSAPANCMRPESPSRER